MHLRPLSIRTHIWLIVLVASVLPLALDGLWLTRRTVDAGTALLRTHLASEADRIELAAEQRWEYRRGDLALLAGNDAIVHVLVTGRINGPDSAYLRRLFESVEETITSVTAFDPTGTARWDARVPVGAKIPGPIIVRLPIVGPHGEILGRLVAAVRLRSIVSADIGRPFIPGAKVAFRDLVTGSVLLPLDERLAFPDSGEIALASRSWFAVHRPIRGSHLELAIAAPSERYVAPFQRDASIGIVTLIAVLLFAGATTVHLTARLTGPIRRLADASDAVAQGHLQGRVEAAGPRELQRLSVSFNAMTDSLRDTLAELSRRGALAAVGEFAASLAHEVRNALTSVRIDLQRVAKRPGGDTVSDELVRRVLQNVARLDSVVSGALQVARGGQAPAATLDLRDVLNAAAEAVAGSYFALSSSIELPRSPAPIWVRGDGSALEQLFLNLFLNAGQAAKPGSQTRVSVDGRFDQVLVSVIDSGTGMTPQQVASAFEPFETSKHHGVGLGLPIASRIASAHGGRLSISSVSGRGTTVEVALPLESAARVAGGQSVQTSASPREPGRSSSEGRMGV